MRSFEEMNKNGRIGSSFSLINVRRHAKREDERDQ